MVFVNDEGVKDKLWALKEVSTTNSFAGCLDMIMYEQLEIKAIEETIKVKEQLEIKKSEMEQDLISQQGELAKLMGGKTTFKSIFSRGSKAEQIQKLESGIPEL